MRALLLVLIVLAAAGGAYLLLFGGDPAPESGAEDRPSPVIGARPGAGPGVVPAPAPGGARRDAPRMGVMGPADRDLVGEPLAESWHVLLLPFAEGEGVRLTGKLLVDAVAKHLYVRAKDQATLDALLAETFEPSANHPMPMGALVPLLRERGYGVDVREPRFLVRRLPREERPEPR